MNDGQPVWNVVVVTEAPQDLSTPGKNRRYLAISEWAQKSSLPINVKNVAVRSAPSSRALARIWSALRWRRPKNLPGNTVFIVNALASPHMLILANALAQKNRVIVDVCDSWRLQRRAHVEQKGASGLYSLLGMLIMGISMRFVSVSYISERDATADGPILRRQRVIVIPQGHDKTLLALPPVTYPLDRVVVPLDATSFHNRFGISKFLPELVAWATGSGERVDIYGKGDVDDRSNAIHFAGWAPSLQDVYRGNTAIFVTNVAGSGLPNKALEADAAGRPLIMHDSLSYMKDEVNVPIYWFSGPEDMRSAIENCIAGSSTTRTSTRDAFAQRGDSSASIASTFDWV